LETIGTFNIHKEGIGSLDETLEFVFKEFLFGIGVEQIAGHGAVWVLSSVQNSDALAGLPSGQQQQ
jgi:hypothetical protein